MKTKTPFKRAIAVLLSTALLQFSLGTQAWSQVIPQVRAIAAPVGGAAAAAGASLIRNDGAAAPLALSAASLTAAPTAAPAFFAAPSAAASLPTSPSSAGSPAPAERAPAATAPAAAPAHGPAATGASASSTASIPKSASDAAPSTEAAGVGARGSRRAAEILKDFPAAAYDVEVSQPGQVGRILRLFWPAHTFFRVRQTKVAVDDYLPAKLAAFPQPNPSLLTRIKKGFLFSPLVVALIRSQLAHSFQVFEGRSDRELFESLITHSAERSGKYNIVVEGGRITVARLEHGAKAPDWVLSKHVLMSGYSTDVRFAGEMWKESDGRIRLSNNSGTYRPSDAQLERAVAYLSAVFPTVEFVAFSDPQIGAPAEVKKPARGLRAWLYDGGSDVFKKEVRRKTIHQKNWGYLAAFLLMGYPLGAYVFGAFTVLVGVLELLRMHYPPVRDWAQRRFGAVMREKESKQFTGFFFGALGVATATALYGWSRPIVAAAILAYTVGDAVSPLVGMRFGWKPYTVAGTKRSLDGTLAAFAVVSR
jgi:hypothetical protein